jgi:uncharacterized protein YkwD
MKRIHRSAIALAVAAVAVLVSRPSQAALTWQDKIKVNTNTYLIPPVVSLMNQQRAAYGLAALKIVPELTAAAEWLATDQAAKLYSSHTASDGTNPEQRMRRAGYAGKWFGENIGYAWATNAVPWSDADMMNWWMNSPGHRANILNVNYTEVGVARVDRVIGSTTYRYWVVDFGAR